MEKELKINEINPGKFLTAESTIPNTFQFCADKIIVDSSKLCLCFNEAIWDLERIETLEFEMEGKKYTYKKYNEVKYDKVEICGGIICTKHKWIDGRCESCFIKKGREK